MMAKHQRPPCSRIKKPMHHDRSIHWSATAGVFALWFTVFLGAGSCRPALADDTDRPATLVQMRQQIEAIENNAAAARRRAKKDEEEIERLQRELQKIEAHDAQLTGTTEVLKTSNAQLKAQTDQQIQTLQQDLAHGVSAAQFDDAMSRFLGTHQFTVAGDAAGGFFYDKKTAQNTFSLQFQPIILYRMNDWILFEGSIAASLPNGSGASFALPVATAQIFINDYLEVNAGIFDQPFGDWYEDQSPVWVNRFITAPLLYGAEAIVPPTDIGVQLRGSMQWGALGQDADYTTWISNGPSFDSALPKPAVGQTLNPENNLGLNTNGRAFGTRLRFYPIPIEADLGRLELGASTYNGKWQDSLWFNAWGLDFAYLNRNLQLRGEFARTYRQMPTHSGLDNREGWYIQAGYFLQGLPSTKLSEELDNIIHRLELLTRYSGVNQSAIVTNEITTQPAIGFSGSPSIFSPHAREVALGVDYWIEPSIVWQTEFDLELPGAGGNLLTFKNSSGPFARFAGATPNDHAFLTQLAIGF
jgi:hypothetical protein